MRRKQLPVPEVGEIPATRGYQQEMLEESLKCNIIIALDTGSGKTHIAVLRMKIETEREPTKISWFVAPTVALCEQQRSVIQTSLPVSIGLISGSMEPDQWKNAALWAKVLVTHRIMVTTPQVLLDALRHGYIKLGRDISLLIFDEAHHAVDNHPYNRIMQEFYFELPPRIPNSMIDIMRPCVLGLTASPIYGGNVEKAFKMIEGNLDSIIRAPRNTRAELAQFVHRPVFKHVMYDGLSALEAPFSTNLAALSAIVSTLNIEHDPYVQSLRQQLAKANPRTAEYLRLDQKLSKVILRQDSFTHKGLRDFERTADVILNDLGSWAADWYVWEVIQQAKRAANPFNIIISTWKNSEKVYLLSIIDQIVVSPVSFYPDDIADECSDKVRVLIEVLLSEKFDAEAENESYSGLVFVQRRDTVLALAEILRHHPFTADIFRVGCLLGSSDSAYRHSFLDITRTMLKDTQDDTLSDFKIGEKNVIISTAVAEEGIDIQACGSVIRWDPPQNMASWAQSRGRARRQRSTFTLMFERGGAEQGNVTKWEILEQEMVRLYNDPSRILIEEEEAVEDDADNDVEFRVPSTGALLTLHSAVSHLSHFCAVIPSSAHVDNRPLYDIDPPEIPEGWHSFDNRSKKIPLYTGPYGSKVTLPRTLPLPNREFVTERIYKTKISAHRHVAFMAYKALYDAQLLNESLLPITSVVEPQLEEEVQMMLKDVEKRAGMANVTIQMDPWAPLESGRDEHWWAYDLVIQGLPPLRMFNRSKKIELLDDQGPILYRSGQEPVRTRLHFVGTVSLQDDKIVEAQEYTRMIFWSLNGSRMNWDLLDFSYLFLPSSNADDTVWKPRRSWLSQRNAERGSVQRADEYFANAADFGERFNHPTDLTIVRGGFQFAKGYRFVRWRHEQLNEEEEAEFREYYARFTDLEITYPLLVVQPLPVRTNFLIPTPPRTEPIPEVKAFLLHPRASAITLLSSADTEYAYLLPSILRSLSMTLTVSSLRDTLFTPTPLHCIPITLLTTAMTAPASQEKYNYQRLETLGDTVLKFVVGIQLLAEYPLWHEGYLTKRKDHAVSNVRLAKEDIARGLYRWIIRDMMLGKKWKPSYFSGRDRTPPSSSTKLAVEAVERAKAEKPKIDQKPEDSVKPKDENELRDGEKPKGNEKRKKRAKQQELSTKVLADVVESIIGAAYLHGGFDLGYECAKFFDLGMKWEPSSVRIDTLLSRVEQDHDNIPLQLGHVEEIIGYTFKRKLLLVEALAHASYEQNLHTTSYERMEFLGDSVLDMVVTDFLYHVPGKNYSPGHMHLRKSSVVNAHFLAYICLRCFVDIDAAMPGRNGEGNIAVQDKTHRVHLWQCLLHSSPRILDDQTNTSARYRRGTDTIEAALQNDKIFPWAALTRLQAPKFFSDMVESLIGAVYLDSNGSIHIIKRVLRILGIMQILERIVADDVDVLHPVSRLSLWASKNDKELEYVFHKEKGNVSCAILVDGIEEVRCTERYRGHASQEEVKFMAAEDAIKMFKLKIGDMTGKALKGKRRPTRKRKRKNNSE